MAMGTCTRPRCGVWGGVRTWERGGSWGLRTRGAMCLLWKLGLRVSPGPAPGAPPPWTAAGGAQGRDRSCSVLGAEALAFCHPEARTEHVGIRVSREAPEAGVGIGGCSPGGRARPQNLLWPCVPQPPLRSRGLLTGSQALPTCRACSGAQSLSQPHEAVLSSPGSSAVPPSPGGPGTTLWSWVVAQAPWPEMAEGLPAPGAWRTELSGHLLSLEPPSGKQWGWVGVGDGTALQGAEAGGGPVW